MILDQVGYWADQFVLNSGLAGGNCSRTPSTTTTTSSTAAADAAPPGVILGETGSAVGGGQDGLSNRFADVIEYMDKIGQMTKRGQRRMFRQTLCGSPDQYYALIAHDLTPRPSYFVTAMLNRFVFGGGSKGSNESVGVWNIVASSTSGGGATTGVRMYAWDARTDLPAFPNASSSSSLGVKSSSSNNKPKYIVVALLNLNNTTQSVQLNVAPNPAMNYRTFDPSLPVFRLDIESGNRTLDVDNLLGSPTVCFNEVPMAWSNAGASIRPSLESAGLLKVVNSSNVFPKDVSSVANIDVVATGWSLWWFAVKEVDDDAS